MVRYLRYVIKNLEPVRIADGASSQMGQTNTLRFIPGSSVRGYVVNAFAAKDPGLSSAGAILFSDRIAFLNAYLASDSHSLIPSPKGFYEDKTIAEGKKRVSNVVIDGSFEEGYKRASLGRFCYIEDDCIYYYGVRTGSDMRITMNHEDYGRNVFRNEYLAKDQFFEGYIRFTEPDFPRDDAASLNAGRQDSALTDEPAFSAEGPTLFNEAETAIRKLFEPGREIILGNARSSGMGTCRVMTSEITDRIPYMGEGFSLREDAYLMLLSDTVLRNSMGEICGMDPGDPWFRARMEELLGVTELTIPFASTSTRRVLGYKRKWGAALPSLPVYEAGSVFHLKFKGSIDGDRMEKLCHEGIGLRRNEGFGRILFLRNYELIKYKKAETKPYKSGKERMDSESGITNTESGKACSIPGIENTESGKACSTSEMKTMRTAAMGLYKNALDEAMEYYVTHYSLDRNEISGSRMGAIESRLTRFRYDPEKAYADLCLYFGHVKGKEERQRVQQKRASGAGIQARILNILESSLESTLFDEGNPWPFHERNKVMGIPVAEFFGEKEEGRYKMKLLIRLIRFDRKKEGDENG